MSSAIQGERTNLPQQETEETPEHACPECSGALIWADREQYCEDCGIVWGEDLLDRAGGVYCKRGELSRVSGPMNPLVHDRGLGSEISYGPLDANGNPLTAKDRRRIGRLRTWHGQSKFANGKQRNLAYCLGEVRRITSAIGLGEQYVTQSANLLRQVHGTTFCKGRDLDALVGAIVLAICRINRVGRMLHEIAAVTRADRIDVGRTYRRMDTEIGIPAPPPEPEEYVAAITQQFDLSQTVQNDARELIGLLNNPAVTGSNPCGIAASAVYLAAKREEQWITQSKLADAAGVSVQTLRTNLREIEEVDPRC